MWRRRGLQKSSSLGLGFMTREDAKFPSAACLAGVWEEEMSSCRALLGTSALAEACPGGANWNWRDKCRAFG